MISNDQLNMFRALIARNMLSWSLEINKTVIVASRWFLFYLTYIDDARSHTNQDYIITLKDVSMPIRSLALTLRPYFQYLEKYEKQGLGKTFPKYQLLDSFQFYPWPFLFFKNKYTNTELAKRLLIHYAHSVSISKFSAIKRELVKIKASNSCMYFSSLY